MKKMILITTGPTREQIDPVRYISNNSTGLMGFEIAKEAYRQGFNTIVVAGPCSAKRPKEIKVLEVGTAEEMYKEVKKNLKTADAVVMAAAVSDYRPVEIKKTKLKKSGPMTLKLARTVDILEKISHIKNVVKAGFALETEDLLKNAAEKMKKKKLDIIIANKRDKKNDPFGAGDKTAYMISHNDTVEIKQKTKKYIAKILVKKLKELM